MKTIQNLTEEELNRLRNTNTEWEWNEACDDVKRARGNQYPEDWYQKVLASGVAGAAMVRFTKPK